MDNLRAKKARPPVSIAVRHLLCPIEVKTPAILARAYATGAVECLQDAECLQGELFRQNKTGQYMTTFHAIELGLKAFLIDKGSTEEELRSEYGHDLLKLYKATTAKGLVLSTPDAEALIDWINEWHCNGVKIRYEFIEDRELPMCEALFPLAREIIHKTTLPQPAAVDRVSPLNTDGTVFEVHSVDLKTNAYVYARWLVERERKNFRPDRRYFFELKDGENFVLSAEEIVSRAIATGLPPLVEF